MSIPKIEKISFNHFRGTWEEEAIIVDATRVKLHRDGRVTSELIITTTAPGYGELIHRTSFNLASTRTSKELANELRQRYENAEWRGILEYLSNYVLNEMRRGEPLKLLIPSDNATPPQYLLEPLLVRGHSTILFGDRSAGKTTLALTLLVLVMLPWIDNPLGLNVFSQGINALICDWENDEETLTWQLHCICEGMGLDPITIPYLRCSQPLSESIEDIQKAVDENDIQMVVIDSLGMACSGELNESLSARDFYSALRQLKTTSLILAHTSKEDNRSNKRVFGSVYFETIARNIWEVVKIQAEGSDEMDIGLFHKKPPPFCKLHHTLGYRFSFNSHKTMVAANDPREVSELLDRMGVEVRILEVLRNAGKLMTNTEIYEAANIKNQNTTNATLDRLKKNKKVVNPERGKWGLMFSGGVDNIN